MLKPASIAHFRAAWRISTTSSGVRTGKDSPLPTSIDAPFPGGADHLDATFYVESRANTGERHPELDESDRDSGSHADNDRFSIENPGHSGDVAKHAPDERVDDFEGRDVDQDGFGLGNGDPLGQVVLECHRHLIVHVDLHCHQQAVAHLEDRYTFHPQAPAPWRFTD